MVVLEESAGSYVRNLYEGLRELSREGCPLALVQGSLLEEGGHGLFSWWLRDQGVPEG